MFKSFILKKTHFARFCIGWCSLLCYKIFATTSIFKNLYFPALSFNKVLLQTNNGEEITFAFALVVFKCAL